MHEWLLLSFSGWWSPKWMHHNSLSRISFVWLVQHKYYWYIFPNTSIRMAKNINNIFVCVRHILSISKYLISGDCYTCSILASQTEINYLCVKDILKWKSQLVKARNLWSKVDKQKWIFFSQRFTWINKITRLSKRDIA